jgi:hypothetical protein
MMDPTHEPRDPMTDDAVVAYLRAHAPGLPAVRFNGPAVTAHARGVLRRRRQSRIRISTATLAAATAVYLALAFAGPVPVPGIGTVNVPGSHTLHGLVKDILPPQIPGPDQWLADVDRLEAYVVPVVEELNVSFYGPESHGCRYLEYSRGGYQDGDGCRADGNPPFDTQARIDFDRVAYAIERSGVVVERIDRSQAGIHIRLKDNSWQYDWEYAYMPDGGTPPTTGRQEVQLTNIRGTWWFVREFDD